MSETRHMPEPGPRVETGTVQFGGDWPGVFIRGDNACHWGFSLATFLSSDRADAMLPIERMIIKGLAQTLLSCEVDNGQGGGLQAALALDEKLKRERALDELTKLGQEMGEYDNDG